MAPPPQREMVEAWQARNPQEFIFSAKVPQMASRDKYREGCDAELHKFVAGMSNLGEKLGPMISQFQHVAKGKAPQE